MKVVIVEPNIYFEDTDKSQNMHDCMGKITKKGNFVYCSTMGVLTGNSDVDIVLLSDDVMKLDSFLGMFESKQINTKIKSFAFVTSKKREVPDGLFLVDPFSVKNQFGIDWVKVFNHLNI